MSTPTTSSATNLRQLFENGERVFSAHPQVSHYFPSEAMEDARRRIKRAIDRGDGPALVVGAAGTGKSLLLQALAAQYHKRFDVVLLACARLCTRRALLQTILFELGLSYQHRDEGQLRLGLLDHLLSEKQCPAGLLLLVDEAQALSIAILDELRVMTNLMRGGSPRVRLVLAGSAALEENFAHPDLESFSQRLSARCYLAPMTREETAQFVRAQLAAAGAGPENVFAPDAYDSVFDATDGVPRLINQVCDRALVLAADEYRTLIDRQTIQAAWADLQQLPNAWTAPRETADGPARASQVVEFGSLDDAPTGSPDVAIIEPTELDLDDDEVVLDAEEVDHSPQAIRPPRAPRDPANPFAEQFDEVEVVLDSFAAWDDMFHAGTPRVENHRESGLATLVQAALDASPNFELRPPQPAIVRDNGNDEDHEFAKVDAIEDRPAPDETPFNRPRLRLVPETTDSEPSPPEPAPATIGPVGHTWHDQSMRTESPILIVDDEMASPSNAGPPVRRLAYQHLFSRLRSG